MSLPFIIIKSSLVPLFCIFCIASDCISSMIKVSSNCLDALFKILSSLLNFTPSASFAFNLFSTASASKYPVCALACAMAFFAYLKGKCAVSASPTFNQKIYYPLEKHIVLQWIYILLSKYSQLFYHLHHLWNTD